MSFKIKNLLYTRKSRFRGHTHSLLNSERIIIGGRKIRAGKHIILPTSTYELHKKNIQKYVDLGALEVQDLNTKKPEPVIAQAPVVKITTPVKVETAEVVATPEPAPEPAVEAKEEEVVTTTPEVEEEQIVATPEPTQEPKPTPKPKFTPRTSPLKAKADAQADKETVRPQKVTKRKKSRANRGD